MTRRTERRKDTRTFKDWYGENKKEVNANKKEKYENDSEYRARVKKASQETYRKSKGILGDNMRLIYWDGVRHIAYKISDAADLLGVNKNTFRSYFDKGYLPLFSPDGESLRVVTVDQLELLDVFFTNLETDTLQEVAENMRTYLLENWRNNHGSKKIISEKEKG